MNTDSDTYVIAFDRHGDFAIYELTEAITRNFDAAMSKKFSAQREQYLVVCSIGTLAECDETIKGFTAGSGEKDDPNLKPFTDSLPGLFAKGTHDDPQPLEPDANNPDDLDYLFP